MLKVNHIRGHQDRHCDYDSLSLQAQLNVDADTLAKVETKNFGLCLPDVPFDPVCCTLLSIGGRTIIGEVESAVQHQWFFLKLQDYLCNQSQ